LNTHLQIKLEPGEHKKQPVIFVRFCYNREIINHLKESTSAEWSASKKCWYIIKTDFYLSDFYKAFKSLAYIDYSALKITRKAVISVPKKRDYSYRPGVVLPKEYHDLLRQKRYSENTIKTYTAYFKDFKYFFSESDLNQITINEINAYILYLIDNWKISPSEQNQRINAIKFYYEKVLGREKQIYTIERPRKERKLPNVLSKNELRQLLQTAGNIKHKALIALTYSCGLRRSEVRDMKLEDIDSKQMKVKVVGSKGKKDRYVQLAQNTLDLLRQYYKKEKPAYWLFEGRNGHQYSVESIYNVIRNTAKCAGIHKRVYPHILRHSFATHHLEQGTDLRYIQEWLGHESSQTTEIYTHVSNVNFDRFINPLDELMDEKE